MAYYYNLSLGIDDDNSLLSVCPLPLARYLSIILTNLFIDIGFLNKTDDTNLRNSNGSISRAVISKTLTCGITSDILDREQVKSSLSSTSPSDSSRNEDNNKESKEPGDDYDEKSDKEGEEKQEHDTEEITVTINQVLLIFGSYEYRALSKV